MARTVKPFTKAQQGIVSGLAVTIANQDVELESKQEAIDQLAKAAAFASNIADQRTRQLKDATPNGDRIDVFVAVSGELVLRATKLMSNGLTDVQIHYLDSAAAYSLADDLEYAADELDGFDL